MNPIIFKGHNVVFGANQEEYLPLPAHKNAEGVVTTCWEFTEEEAQELLRTRVLYLQVHTFHNPLQPLLPSVTPFSLES